MKRYRCLSILLFLSLVACSKTGDVPKEAVGSQKSTDLTREKAAQQINSHQNLQKFRDRIFLNTHRANDARSAGILTNDDALTRTGAEHFRGSDQYYLFLKDAIPAPTIEITGIADQGPSSKEALFTWHQAALPSMADRFACKNGTGQAEFRRFDDGWRLEMVDVKYNC